MVTKTVILAVLKDIFEIGIPESTYNLLYETIREKYGPQYATELCIAVDATDGVFYSVLTFEELASKVLP